MNEHQINKLYEDVVKQRNMEIFRPWLTIDPKTKFEICFRDLNGDHSDLMKYLRGFY